MKMRRIAVFLTVLVEVSLLRNGFAGEPSDRPEPGTSLGKAIYEARCSPCHGLEGHGNGPASILLNPRPRDFTTGVYKYRTTESGSLPTDEDLLRTVKAGISGTAMPGWERFIRGDSLASIVSYIKAFSPRFSKEKAKKVQVPLFTAIGAKSAGAGKTVFEKLQCASCHGSDGAGKDASVTQFQDALGNTIRAKDLTEPWTFGGGATAQDVYLRFRTGIDGTPMPSYVGAASEQEMRDVTAYVASLARKPVWKMDASELKEHYNNLDERAGKDPVSWGEHLVHSYGCADCHTPLDGKGGYLGSLFLAGGQRWSLGPYGQFVSFNLTSDSLTGLGAWTDAQIKAVLTKGIRLDGSRMLPFPMPWPSFASLKDRDLNAIVAYLRTIPPVQNSIPKPEPLGLMSYLAQKFSMLVLGKPFAAFIYSGNHGVIPAQVASGQ